MIGYLFFALSDKPLSEPPDSRVLSSILAFGVTVALCLLIVYVFIGFVYDSLELLPQYQPQTPSTSGPPLKVPNVPKRSHDFVDDMSKCYHCHELQALLADEPSLEDNSKWTQKKPADSCFVCHDTKQFVVAHPHTPTPFQDCAMCHALHGTTLIHAHLLKAPTSVLCTQCHEKR